MKTIFWVEDEIEQSSMLTKVFVDNGYASITCDTAEKALKLLENVTPDVFVLDIKLKDMDGITLFNEIKKIDRLKDVPVVFLTAYNSLAAAMEAKKRGAFDYITKPFDVDYLIERIREIIPPAE